MDEKEAFEKWYESEGKVLSNFPKHMARMAWLESQIYMIDRSLAKIKDEPAKVI